MLIKELISLNESHSRWKFVPKAFNGLNSYKAKSAKDDNYIELVKARKADNYEVWYDKNEDTRASFDSVHTNDLKTYLDSLFGLDVPDLSKLNIVREEKIEDLDVATYKGKTIPHEYWTDHVVYKGVNIFKHIYHDTFKEIDTVEKWINNFKSSKVNSVESQECYLGYSPSKDLFILGFDGWMELPNDDDSNESENCAPCITFKIDASNPNKPTCYIVSKTHDCAETGVMWYSRGDGGLKLMHKKYPDLIDIRLD